MSTFTIDAPNGKSYTIEGDSREGALAALKKHLDTDAVPTSPEVSTIGDVAKSGGIGVVKGGIGMLGLPGDAGSLVGRGVDAIGSAFGATPESTKQFKDTAGSLLRNNPVTSIPARLLQGPGSQDLKSDLESVTGPLYEPKTTAGQYAQTLGEFAPAAIGGPESLALRIATRVAAPAIASETAGQFTKGTTAEPYARVAGALVGGVGASAGVNKFLDLIAARKAAQAVPTADALKDAARAGYDHPDVAAVQIKPQAVDNLGTTIENDLLKQGFRARPGQGGPVFDTIAELKNAPGPVSIQDIDSIRKALGQVGRSGIPTADSVAANKAISHLDDFLPNLNQSDLLAGDATNANQILQDARGNWAAAKRSNMLTDKIDAAELQAASANSGHNVENALRQRMRSVLTSSKLSRGLNSDEKDAIEAFVRGGPMSNAIRHIGNYLGGGGGLGHLITTGAGAAVAGVPGAIAAPVAGMAIKAISNMNAASQVKALDALLRSRSPEALKVAQQMPPQLVNFLSKQSAAILAGLMAQPLATQVPQVTQVR